MAATRQVFFALFVVTAAWLLTACSGSADKGDPRLHILQYESEILGKGMISQVYLPQDYDEEKAYPVLYFLPSGGGSSYTVFSQLDICQAHDKLVESGEIPPFILVAPGIDLSFAMNSAENTARVQTEYDQLSFDLGRYEDYFLNELIPLIEGRFAVSGKREDRYIGGYSMGGLGALHLSMLNPELFRRAGGHSPTLFLDDEIDLANQTFRMVKDYFYATEEHQRERNPIYLAQSADLSGLSLYLDTGPGDVNARAVVALGDVLAERGVDAQTHLFPGSHGFFYCNTYMEEYLRFYAGQGEENTTSQPLS